MARKAWKMAAGVEVQGVGEGVGGGGAEDL